MSIIIFGLGIDSYEMITDYLSSAWCEWIVDGEHDTFDVKLSKYTKFNTIDNCIELGYNGGSVMLDRCDYNYIKIE